MGQCPAVWSDVASTLQTAFAGCNDDARAALRAPFHDCVNGACDGSLVLGGECTRSENAGLEPYCDKISTWATQFDVGTADTIQFAQAVALAVCPGGPRIRALVGRQDSSTPAPEGIVPDPSDSVASILATFAAVGLSTTDVVALVGAHSTAKQFFDDPSQAGASLDSTPDAWDINFYGQTLAGTAPYTLESDKKMSTDLTTAVQWLDFSLNQAGWAAAFTSAMDKFTVTGNDVSILADCSSVLPGAAKIRREAMKAPIGERVFSRRIET
ncbi:class II peroxidase [Lentithecium fluviatile CBS 122367]|uniref:Peroxidase n=1 Tax=Lentithecium fluviatile CBS 122367 TaxID=1168545 RepID=A0A6G1IPY5_9PLEO|nr:class II peroxidase [Lentithecium fluviatile CBS 122367]